MGEPKIDGYAYTVFLASTVERSYEIAKVPYSNRGKDGDVHLHESHRAFHFRRFVNRKSFSDSAGEAYSDRKLALSNRRQRLQNELEEIDKDIDIDSDRVPIEGGPTPHAWGPESRAARVCKKCDEVWPTGAPEPRACRQRS